MQVLGIALNEGKNGISKLKAFRKDHGLSYPLLLDEPAAIISKFGFSGIPQDVVLDTAGKYIAAPQTIEDLAKVLKKMGK